MVLCFLEYFKIGKRKNKNDKLINPTIDTEDSIILFSSADAEAVDRLELIIY